METKQRAHVVHIKINEESSRAVCGDQWTPMPQTHMVVKKPCVACNLAVHDGG